MRARITSRRLGTGVAIAAILVIGLAASLWTILETSSGALVLTSCGAWGLGAGIAGWHLRSWSWPGTCPAAMLLLILLWVAVFRHSSWTSAFITVLGAMFAVAAAIGAVLGTWFGKRRRSPG
jgi:membrane-bound ClpP family serine protease